MAIKAMRKKNGEFHCKSCSKKIIDFRDKSYNDVKKESTPETCGIFNDYQVKTHTNYNYHKKFLFKALTILSLIGFNVSPLSANAYSLGKEEKMEINGEKEKGKSKKEKKKKKKRWNPFRKKKRFPAVGCPSF